MRGLSVLAEQCFHQPRSLHTDNMLAGPNNAGELAQAALNKFRTRIAQFAPDGLIDARALYAIRKDINDMLGESSTVRRPICGMHRGSS